MGFETVIKQPLSRKPIKNIKAALCSYYEKEAIGNKDIVEIFGNMSSATIAEMKRAVRKAELEKGLPIFQSRYVHTETAFEVWQINIKSLEAKYRKSLLINKIGGENEQ